MGVKSSGSIGIRKMSEVRYKIAKFIVINTHRMLIKLRLIS